MSGHTQPLPQMQLVLSLSLFPQSKAEERIPPYPPPISCTQKRRRRRRRRMADCFFGGCAAITRDERRMQRKEEKGRTKRDFSSCPVSVATSFKGVKGEKGEREQARFSCFCFLFSKKIGKLEAEAQKMGFFLSFDRKRDWRKNARQKGILLLMPTFVSFPPGNHVSLLFENAKSACVQDIRRIFLPFPCAKKYWALAMLGISRHCEAKAYFNEQT